MVDICLAPLALVIATSANRCVMWVKNIDEELPAKHAIGNEPKLLDVSGVEEDGQTFTVSRLHNSLSDNCANIWGGGN